MPDKLTPSTDRSGAIERRLATIMMADVAGYSRMMGQNEEGTVAVLRGHREIFDGLLEAHRGRVFNTAGDAICAEFPSAVEAVRCATEIQTALRTRNEHLPAEQRMWFRIGINLGDVIVQGEDLLGDGVNVAARIQSIAEPGGICISGSVYDQIQNKLTLQIRQLGEKSFKNIAQPVRTFSISDEGGAVPTGARWRGSRTRSLAAAAAIVGVVAAGATGYWMYREYALRSAEEARRTEDSRRAVEQQLKAERERAAKANAEREAMLLAQVQAAKDALTQAEETKRKAAQDRLAAEAAQKEARLQGELRSARDAVQQAAESVKKANDERLAVAAAMKSAEAASKNPKAERQVAVASEKTDADARSAPQPGCRVEPFQGATSPAGAVVRMRVGNTGSPCRIVNYGVPSEHANPADSGTITASPAHGKAEFAAPTVKYTADHGFVGDDEFAYEAFANGKRGERLHLRARVKVTVVAP
jgi:class 3 adenylate cyclase